MVLSDAAYLCGLDGMDGNRVWGGYVRGNHPGTTSISVRLGTDLWFDETVCISSRSYGRGTVVLFSPHPELTDTNFRGSNKYWVLARLAVYVYVYVYIGKAMGGHRAEMGLTDLVKQVGDSCIN